MSFYIGTTTISSKQWIQIDEKKYTRIRRHKDYLIRALEIEELFDVLIGNYIEFEEELLSITLNHSIMLYQNVNEFHAHRRDLNRRIANLLSSARYFIDSLQHNINNIFGKDSTQDIELKKEISKHYDTNFSYRLMCELRNYVQHKGMAADSFASNYQLIKIQQGAPVACTVTPLLVMKNFLADKKIKSKIRKEISDLSLPDTVDLKPYIREYMNSLNTINSNVRSLIEHEYSEWATTICSTIEQHAKHFTLPDMKNVIGLAIFQCTEDNSNTIIEKHEIFTDFIEYRKHLYDTNKVTDDFTRIFVTSQTKDSLETAE